MKELARQDRNGTRTTTDIERRYKLQQLDPTIEDVEDLKKKTVVDSHLSATSLNPVENKVITTALNNKVNTESGKGLSSNDYTSAEKEKVGNALLSTNIKAGSNITITRSGNDCTINAVMETIDMIYPVGSIYMSVNSTNPSTLFGGTWVEFGKGRTLVGVDTTQTEFDTVEKTGGEKTHTLTVSEMPTHTHNIRGRIDRYQGSGTVFREPYDPNDIDGERDNNISTYSTGGSQSHNNLQPYITCYMWKRTA